MTTSQSHDDIPRSSDTAPDWTSSAYDPHPAPYYPEHPHPLAPSGGTPAAPTVMAVLAAILFAPLGIWALILAGQVGTKAAAGDIVGALAAANKAKTVSYVGITVGGLIVLFLCAGACSAMSNPYYYGAY